jgi:hypothetical protein
MLFKNNLAIGILSVIIILSISIYKPFLRKSIKQGFQNPSECILDCQNKESMAAAKREFESNYLEGFQNQYTEAFQNPTQILSTLQSVSGLTGAIPGFSSPQNTTATNPLALLSSLGGNALPSLQNLTGVKMPAEKLSRYNLKKIHRTLKLGTDKCEYEVTFDKEDLKLDGTFEKTENMFGYFQATFLKDKDICQFKPKEVRILVGPKIIRNDTLGKLEENIVVDYTF